MNINRTLILISLSLLAAVSSWAGVATIRVTAMDGSDFSAHCMGMKATGVDTLLVTSDLSQMELTYTGSAAAADCNWYNITNRQTPAFGQTRSINPDDETYLLVAGQDSLVIAVVDYRKYPYSSLSIDATQPDECSYVYLTAQGPLIHYNALSYGTVKQQLLSRQMGICYTSLGWDGNQWQDSAIVKYFTPSQQAEQVKVVAPLRNTAFCLKDSLANRLSISADSLCTPVYTAVAVDCHLTTTTVSRQDGNELQRPDTSTVKGSGPLEILFKSNPTPAVRYYEWRINKGSDRIATRQDETTRYTFQEGGATYSVGLTVRNDQCMKTADSVSVSVVNSMLQVPNVFTPNGDGMNDEFRVAYKSIREFHCYVFNRWGRKVYSSSDIQKGWDGKINGQNAAMGTYFYVIKAEGEDGERYFESGDINLLR